MKNEIFEQLDEGALVWTPDGLYMKPAQDPRFHLTGCLVSIGHKGTLAHYSVFEWLKPVKLCILCTYIYQWPKANVNISTCTEFNLKRR